MNSRREFLKEAAASAACAALLEIAPDARAAFSDTAPVLSSVQLNWLKLGYGMFLHFGPNTFAGVGWGDGKFPARAFAPSALDCGQWAEVAREAGMRYAVLTAKHHDGFCLWPSQHTDYCVKNSPAGDVCAKFVEAFHRAGIQTGFYYSLWDRNCPFYEDDKAYAEYMREQLSELLTQYGPVTEVFFDGAWDKDYPTREWSYDPAWEKNANSGLGHGERWEWTKLYTMIHRYQPQCIVLNNSSSDRPGCVRYSPLDARTAERFDFIYHDRVVEPIIDPRYTTANGHAFGLPLEFCDTLTPDWFWKKTDYFIHPSAETIAGWRFRAQAARANLLLNVGPDSRGLIPEYNQLFLRMASAELRRCRSSAMS